MADLKNSSPTEHFDPAQWTHRGRTELANFKALGNWHDRLLLSREHLFPSRSYMYAKYKTDKPFLLPLLYLARIAQAIPKLLK